eukprot:412644_1
MHQTRQAIITGHMLETACESFNNTTERIVQPKKSENVSKMAMISQHEQVQDRSKSGLCNIRKGLLAVSKALRFGAQLLRTIIIRIEQVAIHSCGGMGVGIGRNKHFIIKYRMMTEHMESQGKLKNRVQT